MKYMSGNEIRKRFLKFFEDRGHLVLPSASLIPQDDPTLLLIGAGMAPFKPFFTGKMKPPSPRITTCQKCVRTGDIENVGRTARHHTYFEMLGDFSFGDYFKKEIIPWSWEFLTKELELPADKLWVTIHPTDDEAYEIWHNVVGVPDERIVRLEENFWETGSGPCGPDSELHIDMGEERVASVLQGKPSNFETDLIFPIIEYAAKVAGVEYGKDKKTDVSLKVIADHVRSITFMIADGVLPSNEGRGYVLRRVLRRAVRHARLIGIEDKFLNGAVDVVIDMFKEPYPYLVEKTSFIHKVIEMEETSFLRTLRQGCDLLYTEIESLKKENKTVLDGATAFRLSDTFGFPRELTAEILEEEGMTMDDKAFNEALEVQRKMARDARDDKTGRPVIYNTRSIDLASLKVDEGAQGGKIAAMYPAHDAQPVESMEDGKKAAVITDVTAFHAEGGGQLGDTGRIIAPAGVMQVEITKKLPDGATIMIGTVTEGTVAVGDEVKFEIERGRKNDIARNHTATHLLHAALKQVLGDHVNQAGSYVGPDRLRFDFSHFSPVTEEELRRVEEIVNDQILAAKDVTIEELPIDEAKKRGAVALFGEKYGSIVRVVTVPGFSMEFCGGVHVGNTAQIGMFKILSESSTGAGVRRIEAVTGHGALNYVREMEDMVKTAATGLKCRSNDLCARICALQSDYKAAEQKISELEGQIAKAQVSDAASSVCDIKGVPVLVQKVSAGDVEALRSLGDQMRDKVGGVVVLADVIDSGKINILAMATKDAVAKGIHAGQIVKEVARVCGGGGGGRPDMAQAGGKDASKLDEALKTALTVIEGQIK